MAVHQAQCTLRNLREVGPLPQDGRLVRNHEGGDRCSRRRIRPGRLEATRWVGQAANANSTTHGGPKEQRTPASEIGAESHHLRAAAAAAASAAVDNGRNNTSHGGSEELGIDEGGVGAAIRHDTISNNRKGEAEAEGHHPSHGGSKEQKSRGKGCAREKAGGSKKQLLEILAQGEAEEHHPSYGGSKEQLLASEVASWDDDVAYCTHFFQRLSYSSAYSGLDAEAHSQANILGADNQADIRADNGADRNG